ncbi:MAG: transglycosylase family protein [Thermoleophilia bacterium]|nr:transglycosylase family protein [Thermoleophilia bacterium]
MSTPRLVLARFAAVAVAVLALALDAGAAGAAESPTPILDRIQKYRAETWRWQRLMRVPLTRTDRRAERSRSIAFRRWVASYWQEQARRARRRAHNPPRLQAWLCIHRHEAAWNANTGNGYYGGLQMDLAFQRRYGTELLRRKGTANRWSAVEQIWVGERAYRSGRRFSPWPNAARVCGVL